MLVNEAKLELKTFKALRYLLSKGALSRIVEKSDVRREARTHYSRLEQMLGQYCHLWALIEFELGTQKAHSRIWNSPDTLDQSVLRFVPRKGGMRLVQRDPAACRRVTSKHRVRKKWFSKLPWNDLRSNATNHLRGCHLQDLVGRRRRRHCQKVPRQGRTARRQLRRRRRQPQRRILCSSGPHCKQISKSYWHGWKQSRPTIIYASKMKASIQAAKELNDPF